MSRIKSAFDFPGAALDGGLGGCGISRAGSIWSLHTLTSAAGHGERSEGRLPPVGVGAGVLPAWRRDEGGGGGGEDPQLPRPNARASDTSASDPPASNASSGHGEIGPPLPGHAVTKPWPGAGRTRSVRVSRSVSQQGDGQDPLRLLSTVTRGHPGHPLKQAPLAAAADSPADTRSGCPPAPPDGR